MPINENQLSEIQKELEMLTIDSYKTFRQLLEFASSNFPDHAQQFFSAVEEFDSDFMRPDEGNEESLMQRRIRSASLESLQDAGLYGSQLALKSRQVKEANENVRKSIETQGASERFWKGKFIDWINRINNFLGSLQVGTGFGEALKELKDCLQDEIESE